MSSDNQLLSILSVDLLKQMQQLLNNNGFTSPTAVKGIKLLGGRRAPSDTGRVPNHLMPSLGVSGFPGALETLLRLFIFGATVERELAVQAFSPMALGDTGYPRGY